MRKAEPSVGFQKQEAGTRESCVANEDDVT